MDNAIKIICSNKKAYHNFFISDTFEAGIVLEGSEVKSIRDGSFSLNDSYVFVKKNEIWLKNAYIKPYDKSGSFIPESTRDRKLLLHKIEIEKLTRKVKEKTFTIVPTKAYFKNNKVKVEIALAKGKKLYDKKEVLAEKSIQRNLEQELKNRGFH